eukprot:SAG22_NODE_76_length_22248_cov_14.352070_6_plen_60_part_00
MLLLRFVVKKEVFCGTYLFIFYHINHTPAHTLNQSTHCLKSAAPRRRLLLPPWMNQSNG